MLDQNLDLKEKLASVIDRATQEAVALLLSQRATENPSVESAPEWMTGSQLARYWQLVNTHGEPTTAGIMKWARRAENEQPLPHAYMVTYSGSTETRPTCGHAKRQRGDGCRMNSGVSRSREQTDVTVKPSGFRIEPL